MKSFDQEDFNYFALKNRVVGFYKEAVPLKCGKKSHCYVDWSEVMNDVYSIDKLADFVIAFTEDLLAERTLDADNISFLGVAEGTTRLGLVTQFKWAKTRERLFRGSHSLPMGRADSSDYGPKKKGAFLGRPKGDVILLEDVTTTGSSLLTTINALTEIEVPVVAAIGLTNRMGLSPEGEQIAEPMPQATSMERRISYFHLSLARDLLPEAYRKIEPDPSIKDALEKELGTC